MIDFAVFTDNDDLSDYFLNFTKICYYLLDLSNIK